MYKNVGKKVQKLATVIGIGLLIAGFISFIIMISAGNKYLIPWAWFALGIGLISFVSSWFMYAFGQLVDDVHAMREKQDVKND